MRQHGTLSVLPVRDAGELRRFLDVPYRLHRDEPRWVPPLRSDLHARIRFRRNPFWKRADGRLFLARRGGDVVGRISVHLDAAAEADRSVALFGWFECDEDADAARALFDAAAGWAAEAGARRLLGPASFTAIDEAGLLVEGFDEPASFMAPWHPPRYAELMAGCRFEPDGVLHTVAVPCVAGGSESRASLRGAVRASVHRAGEATALVAGHPAAWALTPAEVSARLARFRPLLDRPLAAVEEAGGDAPDRAVALAARDLSDVLVRLRDRLGARGVAGVWREARRSPRAAVLIFVSGAAAVARLAAGAGAAGYECLEATVSPEAVQIGAALEALGGRTLRVYRTFGRDL